jgi:hypothetical protein
MEIKQTLMKKNNEIELSLKAAQEKRQSNDQEPSEHTQPNSKQT